MMRAMRAQTVQEMCISCTVEADRAE